MPDPHQVPCYVRVWRYDATLVLLTVSDTYQTIISLCWIITQLSGFISLAREVFPDEAQVRFRFEIRKRD